MMEREVVEEVCVGGVIRLVWGAKAWIEVVVVAAMPRRRSCWDDKIVMVLFFI